MSDHERRRLTAILAADVAGFSRLTGADEEGTMRRLRALRAELIDPAVVRHDGRIVKTTGDGLLVEFASVVDAARCAIELQRAMTRRNEDFVAEKRIEFRVGIHLGDVMVEADGDLLGDGVNIAARLEGIAEPGGISLSHAAYEQVRDKIGESFIDRGEIALKNIARPVRVYAISPPSYATPAQAGVHSSDAAPSTTVDRGFRRGGNNGESPRLSIVVLPFANIGGDPEQEYFVDGVTEDLTTELSRQSGAFVIARNTAFSYKGKSPNIRDVGRELCVRYVLEGSVRRGGNRLRVNVQLIDTETGAHLWAERFDRDYGDLFEMQDEIVARLARAMEVELTNAEARRAARAVNPDAMDLYFRGKAAMNRGSNPEILREARGFFEQALALDPKQADARAVLARIFVAAIIQAYYDGHFMEDRATLARMAEAMAIDALAIAPNHAAAHFALGLLYLWTGRQAAGIAQFEHAIALDRNFAEAHGGIGNAKNLSGRAEETQAHIDEAFRISPRDPEAYVWHFLAGLGKLLLGRDQEAALALQKAVEANRNSPPQYFYLAAALALTDRMAEARAAATAGQALDSGFTIASRLAVLVSSHPTYVAQMARILDA
ncbi:MAG: adenylate/guanylate cyclase domain-containing protein, partial [Stellaceae bacterium]